MPIWREAKVKINEKLKEKILQQEEQKIFSSVKFKKIEDQVKDSLKRRETDSALYDLTIWALILWASDIHYEVFEDEVEVRFRIDGILVNVFNLELKQYKLILERLKYSANLKLNIVNVPQDGKYELKIKEKKDTKLDVRVSTLPTKYGENVVCRLLDASKAIVDFEDLGFFWTSKRMIEKAISKKNGLILVTWPTGSGKTTTLYTILSKLNTPDKKIITLEDPIEYELPWVIQAEVNEKLGFTYQTWLKALLRQDPDIIMVWEIRDKATLDTATSASLTGHLVLSTLHTKSAADTLDRVINMWLKPYILASAIDTIIAQRLVRKICPHCKTEKEKTPWETALIKNMMEDIWMKWMPAEKLKLYHWEWCDKCSWSGYKWRIWIFEIITLNEELKDLIREWATADEIIKSARGKDLILMQEDGILKAIKGYTTIEEVLRVT